MSALPTNVATRREKSRFVKDVPVAPEVLSQKSFRRMIAIERKRTGRTNDPFLLLLLEAGRDQEQKTTEESLALIASSLSSSLRDTDIIGWYHERATLGVIFTGLQIKDKNLTASSILNKVNAALQTDKLLDQISDVTMSIYFFPDDWDDCEFGSPMSPALYSDQPSPNRSGTFALKIKRAMDVTGSASLLFVLSPVLAAVALAVWCTSKGPVLFKQPRVGQHGKQFTFLKFRSMTYDNDHSAHKDYVTKFIANEAEHQLVNPKGSGIYKLTQDKRVTPVGKFLRRSSLDELPQLLNVLKGDMSLVGPRPPIPYEVAAYRSWHLGRLTVKPGITGLWQVTGRNRVKFDEMVRLDQKYASSWTLWLDLKIILKTPLAVIRGAGAV